LERADIDTTATPREELTCTLPHQNCLPPTASSTCLFVHGTPHIKRGTGLTGAKEHPHPPVWARNRPVPLSERFGATFRHQQAYPDTGKCETPYAQPATCTAGKKRTMGTHTKPDSFKNPSSSAAAASWRPMAGQKANEPAQSTHSLTKTEQHLGLSGMQELRAEQQQVLLAAHQGLVSPGLQVLLPPPSNQALLCTVANHTR